MIFFSFKNLKYIKIVFNASVTLDKFSPKQLNFLMTLITLEFSEGEYFFILATA